MLYGLLLFRGQELSGEDIDRAAGIFGEISFEGEYGTKPYVSNVVPDGLVPTGELRFHTDKSFTARPLRGLALYAYEVPPQGAGGDTIFANVMLAHQRLSPGLRGRIEGLQVVHSTRISSPPVTSTLPLAFPHPVTGEKVLFYSAQFFAAFVGLNSSQTEALRHELDAAIADPHCAYRHAWRPHDLIVWDNVKLQHARMDFDPAHRRHLRRIQIDADPVEIEPESCGTEAKA